MLGQALADASAAARSFIRSKPRNDRVAVVAVGERAVLLTGFSSSRIDADAALRTMSVDTVRGTALYDAVVLSAQALAADAPGARVLVLLTDGQEVTSEASLKEADRRRPRGRSRRLSDRHRKPELLAAAAQAARQGDGRPLLRGRRHGRPRADLRLARPGAAPDVAAQLRDERSTGRTARARGCRSARGDGGAGRACRAQVSALTAPRLRFQDRRAAGGVRGRRLRPPRR